MSRPMTLRVGICACAERYHGKLEQQRLQVGRGVFRLREIIVPEEGEDSDTVLLAERCHFFVDLHSYQYQYQHMYLCAVEMCDPDGPLDPDWWDSCTRKPPSPQRVLREMTKLLKDYRGQYPRKFTQWLKRMSCAKPRQIRTAAR